ncbi:hypothetical protein ABE545_16710 [Sphingobacterium faecium]|jgi:Mg2+/Co2+ transporter CorB|uniref:hypothetical protein n=1 Tax=Sphingobacterium faecium TaxID=34087 RepID=UPI00320A2011
MKTLINIIIYAACSGAFVFWILHVSSTLQINHNLNKQKEIERVLAIQQWYFIPDSTEAHSKHECCKADEE